MAAAERRDRIEPDPARVVAPVAQEHDPAERQIGGFVGELLQAVGDVRRRRACLQLFEVGDARELAVQPIEARLKFLLERGEHAALQHLHGLVESRRSVLHRRHAARVVHEHRDDVLLRLELRD